MPDSDLAVAAQQLIFDAGPVFIAHHSVRSYLFAGALAEATGLRRDVDYDDEILFLSCLLHDLGATDYANGDQRFEVDGADAAAQFLREHGAQESKIEVVWQAIALHTSVGLAHRFGPVQAVAQMGISADVLGVGKQLLPAGFAEQVHARWPRHDLGYALADVIGRQIAANPLKGPRFSFPDHLFQLVAATQRAPNWFELVRAAGWNDQPLTR